MIMFLLKHGHIHMSIDETSAALPVGSSDPIVVSTESMASAEVRDVIQSNIDFVNALFAEMLNETEVSHDAFLSYYADYFLMEYFNGGFAQFVANTGWNPVVVGLVREALDVMGARRHLALFQRGEQDVAALGERLEVFLSSEFFGENAERDALSGIDDDLSELEKTVSLEQINAQWIRSRPNLVVVDEAEIAALVAQRAAGITDREERLAAAREARPEYAKLIERLCEQAGQTLEYITAGDPIHEFEGTTTLAWHFITDQGHHYMVQTEGKALMFVGDSQTKVAELPA